MASAPNTTAVPTAASMPRAMPPNSEPPAVVT